MVVWNHHIPKEIFSFGKRNTRLNILIEGFCKIIAKSVLKKKNLIIIYPFLYCNYLSFFALAAYYTFLDKYRGRYPDQVKRVLIITSKENIHARLYDTIKRENEIVQTFIQYGRILEDGRIERLSKYVHPKVRRKFSQCEDCLVLFSKFTNIPLPDRVKCIIIDLDSVSRDVFINSIPNIKLLTEGIDSLIFVISTIDKEIIDLIRKEFDALTFGFHPLLIKMHFSQSEIGKWVLWDGSEIKIPYENFGQTYREKVFIFPCVERDEVTSQLVKCWKGFYSLKEIANMYPDTLNIIQKILNKLQTAIAPPRITSEKEKEMWYLYEKPLDEEIEMLENECGKENALKSVIIDIKRLYDLLSQPQNNGGKIAQFQRIIDKFVDANEDILICSSSKAECYALREWLAEKYTNGNEKDLRIFGIYVEHYSDLHKLKRKFDYIILSNVFVKESIITKTLLSPLFKRCIILAYPTEFKPIYNLIKKLTTSLDYIFIDEVCTNLQELLETKDEEIALNNLLSLLSLSGDTIQSFDALRSSKKIKLQLFSELESRKELIKKIEQWSDIVAEVQEIVNEAISKVMLKTPVRISKTLLSTTDKKAKEFVKIQFTDGRELRYPKSQSVDVVYGDEIRRKKASNLKQGDRILLIDNNYQKNLLALILEKLSNSEYRSQVKLAEKWWQRLKQHAEYNSHTPKDIFNLLKSRGSDIKTVSTIRNWLQGNVYGPYDPKNIRIIGEIYEDDFLTEYWKDIEEAVKKIRAIHRKTGRMIARKIKMLLKGIFFDERTVRIDSSIGLTLRDIADHIEILQVQKVEEEENTHNNYQ